MLSLCPTSPFVAPKTPSKLFYTLRDNNDHCTRYTSFLLKSKNASMFRCQASKNSRSYNGLPYVSTGLTEVGDLNDIEVDTGIGILKFFQGKSILITGGTGLVAKAVIEKILRAIPDVGKLFVLIKAENKQDAVDRLKTEIIDSDLFECLRYVHGKSYEAFMSSKLVPVVGNLCEYNLGMEAYSIHEITQEVDVIINSAANTTFDERYDVAIDTNTRGPRRLFNFGQKCKKLCLFLHVSTAYVSGERKGIIKEKPLREGESLARERSVTSEHPFLDIDAEIKLALDSSLACQDNERAQKMTELGLERARIYGWRNPYEFTKAMGEMRINSMRGEIPVVIVRPPAIESTFKEPFPGWIQGNRMLDPLILSYGKGQLPGFFVNPKAVIDIMPLDMVVNAIIAAVAKHGSDRKPDITVYQVGSSIANPLLLHDLFKYSCEHFNSSPFIDSEGKAIDIMGMRFFNSMQDFSLYMWKHIVQQNGVTNGTISDSNLSPRVERKSKKMLDHAIRLAKVYEPYMFGEGWFDNGNIQKLIEAMSEEEKQSFVFDVRSLGWKDYIFNVHIPGLKKHVMKGRNVV